MKVIQQLEFPTTLERINNLNIVLIGVFRFKIFKAPKQDHFGKQIFLDLKIFVCSSLGCVRTLEIYQRKKKARPNDASWTFFWFIQATAPRIPGEETAKR